MEASDPRIPGKGGLKHARWTKSQHRVRAAACLNLRNQKRPEICLHLGLLMLSKCVNFAFHLGQPSSRSNVSRKQVQSIWLGAFWCRDPPSLSSTLSASVKLMNSIHPLFIVQGVCYSLQDLHLASWSLAGVSGQQQHETSSPDACGSPLTLTHFESWSTC